MAITTGPQALATDSATLRWAQSFLTNQINLAELDAIHSTTSRSPHLKKRYINRSTLVPLLIKARASLHESKALKQNLKATHGALALLISYEARYAKKIPSTEPGMVPTPQKFPCVKHKEHIERYRILSRPSSGRAVDYRGIQNLIGSWNLPQIRCFSASLLSRVPQASPQMPNLQHLLTVYQQLPAPMSEDIEMGIFSAIHYLQHQNFPEALRHLYWMTRKDPAFLESYDAVQRIYSHRQNDIGDVSLKTL